MRITLLGVLNFLILQLFFIRLGKSYDVETNEYQGLVLIFWIVPYTGWWNDYKFIGKQKTNIFLQ